MEGIKNYSDLYSYWGGGGSSCDVDIVIGGVLLNDDTWLQRGEGVKNLGKSDYVIYGCSLCKSQI